MTESRKEARPAGLEISLDLRTTMKPASYVAIVAVILISFLPACDTLQGRMSPIGSETGLPGLTNLPRKPVGTMRNVDGVDIWDGGFPKQASIVVLHRIHFSQEEELVALVKKEGAHDAVINAPTFLAEAFYGHRYLKRSIEALLIFRYSR